MRHKEYLQIFHIISEWIRYDIKVSGWYGKARVGDMFGYVRVYQPELKMGEFEQYRGVYCALCKQLGKRYGFFARMTLSYDFTFLALFRMALDDGCVGFRKGRCVFNPLKKRMCCCDNSHLHDAADAATLMVYYKLKDNIADSGFFPALPARLLLPFAALARRKALKRQPELDRIVAGCMEQQTELERAGTDSIDLAAEPSAKMLAFLAQLTADDDRERMVLERFGYCLGRWIYLIDAVDDLPGDLDKGRYNPYIYSLQLKKGETERIEKAQKYAILTLNACLAECIASYNLLEIRRFDGILRNILELGMPEAHKRVLSPERDRTHGNGNGRKI